MSDIQYGPHFRISEIKSADSGYEVAGYVSTYGNVDHGGDVVMRGAFDTTLSAKAKVRFLYGHKTDQVLGVPVELKSDDEGLFGRFKISQTQLGRDVHTLLKDGALDSFSIGYIPTEVEYDDAGSRLLKGCELLECSVVAMPMNARATVTAVKQDESDETKAEWTSAYINDLPDSAFAYIEAGGKKDAGGKTTPRSLRHYPHHDSSGKVDLPHLRNALSRAGQNPATGKRALPHLNRHAKSEGVGSGSKTDWLDWTVDLDEDVSFEDLLAQVGEHLKVAAEAAEALRSRRVSQKRELSDAHVDAIKDLLEEAEAQFERLENVIEPALSAPSSSDDGMKLRLELARRLTGYRALETS